MWSPRVGPEAGAGAGAGGRPKAEEGQGAQGQWQGRGQEPKTGAAGSRNRNWIGSTSWRNRIYDKTMQLIGDIDSIWRQMSDSGIKDEGLNHCTDR